MPFVEGAHEQHHHGAHDEVARLNRANRGRLRIVLFIGLLVLAGEVVGGLLSNSLVLLSDAAHMSTDLGSILLAYAAMHLAMRPATSSKSYGYARAEIIAAFLNAVALWVVTAYFFYEAWQRLRAPPDVNAPIVILVGAVSLVANVGLAVVLHRGSGHSLNVRSAYVHILSDALGSAAALVAGLGMYYYGWTWLDPATTFLIGGLILIWTWRLTRDTLHVLLEGAPAHMAPDAVRAAIADVPGVAGVHDLHVWTLTTGQDNLSAHVVVEDPTRGPDVVRAIRARLREAYGLSHITIEVEPKGAECVGAHD